MAETVCRAVDIRRAAMDMLARREHAYQEMFQKLSRKFSDSQLVQEQLDCLVAENLQSDARFCEVYVRSKYQQGQGPRRIGQELKQRGIAAALVQEHLWDSSLDWQEQLQQLYERRYGGKEPLDQKERAKRIRFLQYRGFDFEQIKDVMT